MSCVCILTPVVIAAWPAFSAAVVSAATALGYQIAQPPAEAQRAAVPTTKRVELEIEQSELVTDSLSRASEISVARDGVTVTFSRDARGKAAVCVSGARHSKEDLRRYGEELSQRVVQRYVYQRLMQELEARQFTVVEEEVTANQAIRLKVRHWENV